MTRLLIFMITQATVGLKNIKMNQTVPPRAFLDLLKASWLFTILRSDNRLRDLSDELQAVISLVSGVSTYLTEVVLIQLLINVINFWRP